MLHQRQDRRDPQDYGSEIKADQGKQDTAENHAPVGNRTALCISWYLSQCSAPAMRMERKRDGACFHRKRRLSHYRPTADWLANRSFSSFRPLWHTYL